MFTFATKDPDYYNRCVIAHSADGTWIGNLQIRYDLGIPTKMRDARPGEIITIYGTGFGPTNPPLSPEDVVTQPAPLAKPVKVHFGRTVAEVVYAGQVGSGLYQINLKVPNIAGGDHVIVAEIGGYRSRGDTLISVESR